MSKSWDKKIEHHFQTLVKATHRYVPLGEQKKFERKLRTALILAKESHQGQYRDSGEPYIFHPIDVALILTEYHADLETLQAALLHDTIEDTYVNREIITQKCGKDVANIVEGVTKISEIAGFSRRFRHIPAKKILSIETIRKIFETSEKDIRIIILKIADRLHNMRTLSSLEGSERKQRKAIETQKIFIPFAKRLGLWKMKRQLEDICYEYTDPESYHIVQNFRKKVHTEKQKILKKAIKKLQAYDTELLIQDHKIYNHGTEFLIKKLKKDKILESPDNDLLLHLYVKDSRDAFGLLEVIHRSFPRILREQDFFQKKLHDFYQAYHVRALDDEDNLLEFRIITEEGHIRNMQGVAYDLYQKFTAAHFKIEKSDTDLWKIFQTVNLPTDKDPQAFLSATESDVLSEKIEIFAHKKTYFVPKKTTTLDFAFFAFGRETLHTQEIFQNGIKVGFNTLISPKDRIRVVFSEKATAKYDWLYSLHGSTGRIILQEYFQHHTQEEKIRYGKKMLQKELDLFGLGSIDLFFHRYQKRLEKYGIKSSREALIGIAEGRIIPYEIIEQNIGTDADIPKDENISKPPLIKNLYRKVTYFFYKSRSEGKTPFCLNIKGVLSEHQNPIEKIQHLQNKCQIFTQKQKIVCSDKSNTFQMHYRGVAPSAKKLHRFMSAISDESNILSITPEISGYKKLILLLLLALCVGLWSIIPFVENLLSVTAYPSLGLSPTIRSSLTYLIIIPALVTNLILFQFIKTYIFQLRENRLFLIGTIILNLLAFLLFLWSLITSHNGVNIIIILTIFLIASAFFTYHSIEEKYLETRNEEDMKTLQNRSFREKIIENKEKIYGYLFRISAVVIFGSAPIVAKYFLEEINGIIVTSISFTTSALLLIPVVLIKLLTKKSTKKQNIKNYHISFWISIIFDAIMLMFYFLSLKFIAASESILFLNFAPVVAIIVSTIFWKEKLIYLSSHKYLSKILIAFLIGLIGTTMLAIYKDGIGRIESTWGLIFGVGMLITDVIATIAIIDYAKQKNAFTGTSYITRKILLLSIILAPIGIYYLMNYYQDFTPQNWYGILFISVGYIFFGYWFAYEAFKKIDGLISYLLVNMAPIVTILLEVLITKKPPTIAFLMGALLIVGSAIYAEIVNSKAEKQYIPQKTD
jgi:guanosine-3',5'-bis(diphosphate) 3'-pyrophosphohydrolase